MKRTFIQFAVLLSLLVACNTKQNSTDNTKTDSVAVDSAVIERNIEAREDSLELAKALDLQSKFVNKIQADYETDAVAANLEDDAADDPAIWINRKNKSQSLIIGTQKKAGLYIYNLQGKQQQFVPAGEINNADVRYDFKLGKTLIDIVAGSNRTDNTVVIYGIVADSLKLTQKPIGKIQSKTDEVYGICLYYNPKTKKHYVFVNGKGGKIEQWLLKDNTTEIVGELSRTFSVRSQPEGMIVDDASATLFVGVEQEGIFKYNALPTADTTAIKLPNSDETNPDIAYDIEGMAIYRISPSKAFLIASIQGSFSYAIFDISTENITYKTSFVITDGTVDGAEETDGLEITSIMLGDEFRAGILVVQDGFNKDGNTQRPQNFKIVSVTKILQYL